MQNRAVNAPITFEEIVMVMINDRIIVLSLPWSWQVVVGFLVLVSQHLIRLWEVDENYFCQPMKNQCNWFNCCCYSPKTNQWLFWHLIFTGIKADTSHSKIFCRPEIPVDLLHQILFNILTCSIAFHCIKVWQLF